MDESGWSGLQRYIYLVSQELNCIGSFIYMQCMELNSFTRAMLLGPLSP